MNFWSFLGWFSGFMVVLAAIWVAASYYMVWNIEEPTFTVLKKGQGYEIRQYAPYIIAETKMSGVNSAFSVLAEYIFGGNTSQTNIKMTAPVLVDENVSASEASNNKDSSEKISMTAPVIIGDAQGEQETMSFVMPSKYTITTLPKPNDARVQIKKIKARTIAVRTYSWFGTRERFEKNATELVNLLKKEGITMKTKPVYAGYNPPFTAPFMNRHEVWVEIEP